MTFIRGRAKSWTSLSTGSRTTPLHRTGTTPGPTCSVPYRGWLRRDPAGDPIGFYQRLVRRWGYRADPAGEQGQWVIDEAAVTLAYAELIARGKCRSAVASLARAAIQRQRQQALAAVDWPHRDARLRSLELIEAKLPPAANMERVNYSVVVLGARVAYTAVCFDWPIAK